MKKCVICDTPLDSKNKSKEHIIHNAIGGTLESYEIYCKTCNGRYGSNQDKAFTQIFAPIVAEINMHKSRNTKGTAYTGCMQDMYGNLYTATYKAGKVVKLENSNSEYVRYDSDKFRLLYYDFKLDNASFKLGVSKIAFNYAIHCGLHACCLEKVFDYSKKELISKPVIIPFIPMTVFDQVMEMKPVKRLFHAVRIFNCENFLYAYVELFNTFQQYVLLSEKFNFKECGNICESYGNIIEKNEDLDEELMKKLTPQDFKDADIIINQYHIDIKKVSKDYEPLSNPEQLNSLFKRLGEISYEQVRKQSYIKEYVELIKRHYDTIEFQNIDAEYLLQFFIDFQFYTIYDDDSIEINKYKIILPDGTSYPIAICNMLNNSKFVNSYSNEKFIMLMNRLYDVNHQKYLH